MRKISIYTNLLFPNAFVINYLRFLTYICQTTINQGTHGVWPWKPLGRFPLRPPLNQALTDIAIKCNRRISQNNVHFYTVFTWFQHIVFVFRCISQLLVILNENYWKSLRLWWRRFWKVAYSSVITWHFQIHKSNFTRQCGLLPAPKLCHAFRQSKSCNISNQNTVDQLNRWSSHDSQPSVQREIYVKLADKMNHGSMNSSQQTHKILLTCDASQVVKEFHGFIVFPDCCRSSLCSTPP